MGIFVPIFVLYLVSFLFNINPGLTIFGIPLLFYFPGKFFIEILPSVKIKFGNIGQFALSVLYSFVIASTAGIILQNSYGFNTDLQIWGIISINIFLLFVYYVSCTTKLWTKKSPAKQSVPNQSCIIDIKDFIPLSIFAAVILITVFISPMAQNADNYLIILKQSVANNVYNANTNQIFSGGRELFISYIALASKFLKLNLPFLFRNIYSLLFFVFSFVFYDYLKRNINTRLIASLLYLELLAPSVILTEINIIRPQVALIALTIPIVILSIESIKLKNILSALIALALSIFTLKFHELGIILVLIALLALGANVLRLIFVDKRISKKHILSFLVIAYPYIIILRFTDLFKQAISMGTYALHFFTNLNWRWWFINNYTTIDGSNLGWTGINALLYYLYNGILPLLLILFFTIYVSRKHIKSSFSIWLPAIYLLIYFSFAEILPRIGLFFLPNRAWVHLMLAAVIVLALLIESIKTNKYKIKFLAVILIVTIIIGIFGTFYVAKNNVDEVFKEELPVANFMNNDLPENALILSSQDNMTLVDIYGDKTYSRINMDHLLDRNEFDKLVDEKLNSLSTNQIKITKPKIVRITETSENGVITKREVGTVQEQENQTSKAIYSANDPVYFLYSYRKTTGLNNQREYKKNIIDLVNKDTYKNLGYSIVFSDSSVILIKIK